MAALSRLKAIFEACLGLFHQNMKTLGRKSRRGGMQKPRRRMKRTEPLPKEVRDSTLFEKKRHWTTELDDARARTTSVRVTYECKQSGPEAGRKQVFSGLLMTVAWTEAY